MEYTQARMQPGVTLIEFYASWCPHCQKMMPIVAELKELLNGKAKVYQYDIDKNQEASEEAEVESIPTFIVYRDGREMWRHSGEIDGETLLKEVLSV